MSKTRGQKHICPACGKVFYDLNKPEKKCPSCGGTASGKQKGRTLKNPAKALQKKDKPPIRIEFFRVQENPDKGKGVISGELSLGETFNAGEWYATSATEIKDGVLAAKAATVRLVDPPVTGLASYLTSSRFSGIGPKISEELLKKFPHEILYKLQLSTHKKVASLEVSAEIAKSISSGWAVAPDENLLEIFLSELGFLPTQKAIITELYGANIIKKIVSQPFALVRALPRFSFGDAERLCKKLSIKITEEQRIIAATEYYLDQAEKTYKHTCIPVEQTYLRVSELINISESVISKTVDKNRSLFSFLERKSRAVISTKESSLRDDKIKTELERIWKKYSSKTKGQVFKTEQISTSTSISLSAEQIAAINTTLGSPVSIITGGPGAGKTTMVQGLVSALTELKVKVKLCAPTGKAAKRISETPGLAELDPSTIHRFLGKGRSRKAEEFDLVIVDEASMIDVNLVIELLEAVPDGAGIVFIGDVDQLPPVDAGQPFKDLIESEAYPTSRLTGNFRQDSFSDTVKAARNIIHGRTPSIVDSLQRSDFVFMETPQGEQDRKILELYFDHLPAKLGASHMDIQILSPQWRGEVGVTRLNELIQNKINRGKKPVFTSKVDGHETGYFAGDKVINRKNDYELGVINGDQGIITRKSGQHVMVEINGTEIAFDGLQRHQLRLSYATTIHSSQGSEYAGVIIPVTAAHSRMLSRNLIYTAVTRGKKQVCIVGETAAFENALKQYQKNFRWTCLAEKLIQEADGQQKKITTVDEMMRYLTQNV